MAFTDDDQDGVYGTPRRVWATLTRTISEPYTYTLTAFEQTTYVFDAGGRLAAMYDSHSNQTALSYSGDDLVRVTDVSSGRYVDLSYGSDPSRCG
jgi:uncharacterized protein RhaS with RHS repeats